MIYGIGSDIVQISRIEEIIAKNKDAFTKRVLCEHERHLFENRGASAKFLAKRFAAKEAFAKALGTGIGATVSFLDIMINNDEEGKPFITVSEKLRLKLLELSLNKAHLTITDESHYAVAFVVLEQDDNANPKTHGLGSF